jgi:hypothetical protein
MKIAVFCPIGPLDRFGYQYNFVEILKSHARFADNVILFSSTRFQIPLDSLIANYQNIRLISDPRSWFNTDESGQEIFSMARILQSANLILEQCKQEGMDCAIFLHINQYVPAISINPLRRECQRLLESRRPFAWLYKRYQYADRLFHADTRLPWIFNLQIDNPYQVDADSIRHRTTGKRIAIQHGDYRRKNTQAIVDCPLEMTIDDLRAVKEFTYHYADLRLNAPEVFDPQAYFAYHLRKLNAKKISTEKLDETRSVIARSGQPDFISRSLLAAYSPPNFQRKVLRWIRRLLPHS